MLHSLESRLKEQARALGFDLVGIAAAGPADSFDRLRAWLDHGFAGEMDYLERHADARRHPASILPSVRSVVMVGMNYKPPDGSGRPGEGGKKTGSNDRHEPLTTQYSVLSTQYSVPCAPKPAPNDVPCTASSLTPHSRTRNPGKVARYAQGADYHEVLWRRLDQLLAWVQEHVPGCRGRGVVDTAPLLERDFARRAGLGWFGKNTMLLNKRLGSYFLLGALLLDIELQPDPSFETSHCGTCTACLDACPTQAFLGPGVLDSRRCLSYLTIEIKGPVPDELRGEMKEWLFGCDVCQEVCPWNRKAPAATEPAFEPRDDLVSVDLLELLALTPDDFRRRFRGTALTRAKRRGLIRNAALILGNRGDPAALPALRRLLSDPEPVVRDAACWAIRRIEGHGSADENR